MNPSTHPLYRDTAILSFRLHEQARRHRSRLIGALVGRLAGRLSLPHPAQLQIARWG